MLKSYERRSLSAAARFFDKRSKIACKCGHVTIANRFAKWETLIKSALSMIPQGCGGCAYEHEQNGRCVDCRRVANRTDNYRSK
jgi:hypothetical protein